MTTAIAQAENTPLAEQPSAEMLAQAAIARVKQGSKQPVATSRTRNVETEAWVNGTRPEDFLRDHRIHVKDGSLFIDPYLVLHPAELEPKNEATLRQKLALTYSINNPSFYESYDRVAIALNLGQIIPISLEARHSKLNEEIKKYNAQVANGVDADLNKLQQDKKEPFAAIVRDTLEHPAKDPVGIELLKNGLGIYLLVRERLTQQGFLGNLTSYVNRARTPDQVLCELAPKIGVTPLALREAALKGGLDGVGQLLGLDPAYVKDVHEITEYAANNEFGFHAIEHWHVGRQLLKGEQATFPQKMAVGMEARITGDIEKYRGMVRQHYDVPTPIKAEEKRIAEALNLVEPIQRALMHKLGYEICFTPDHFADDIAKYRGIYGLHRKAANDMRDIRGTYRIYFSGRGDLKGSMRTLVHEIAHNMWPEQFSPEDVKKIDAAANADATRFLALHRIMSEKFDEFDSFLRAYQAGSDAEKAAIAQTTKAYFAAYGVSIDEGALANLRDANELRYLAAYAVDTLRIEGDRYAKSGYDSAHERFREVISRFAELKQVELSGNPRLMQFLAPGLNGVWENHYIPHLHRVYQNVMQAEHGAKDAIAKAQTTPAVVEAAAPKVVERPSEPKVENRPAPTAPVKDAGVDACASHETPSTKVDAPSIHMNPTTLAAMSTLTAMGVHPGR
jgi:hypothetical protein